MTDLAESFLQESERPYPPVAVPNDRHVNMFRLLGNVYDVGLARISEWLPRDLHAMFFKAFATMRAVVLYYSADVTRVRDTNAIIATAVRNKYAAPTLADLVGAQKMSWVYNLNPPSSAPTFYSVVWLTIRTGARLNERTGV